MVGLLGNANRGLGGLDMEGPVAPQHRVCSGPNGSFKTAGEVIIKEAVFTVHSKGLWRCLGKANEAIPSKLGFLGSAINGSSKKAWGKGSEVSRGAIPPIPFMKVKKGSGKGRDNNTLNGLGIRIAFAWSGRETGQREPLPRGVSGREPWRPWRW